VEQKRRIAALEAQMAKHSIQALPDEEKAAKVDKSRSSSPAGDAERQTTY